MTKKRSQIAGQFISRPRQLIKSPSMRVLSRVAHLALMRIEVEHMSHGGAENGRLPITYRQFGECQEILCAGPGYPSRFDEPVVEDDSELGLGLTPFAWRHFPCLRDLAQDEIQQFDRRLIGWKMTSRSHGAPELGVQGFRWRSWCK